MKNITIYPQESERRPGSLKKFGTVLLFFLVSLLVLPVPGLVVTAKADSYKIKTKLQADMNSTWDKVNWNFEANRYGVLEFNMTGDWRVMWFNTPSQEFHIVINGKKVFVESFADNKKFTYVLDSLAFNKEIQVEVLLTLGPHSHHASGSVELTCHEGQQGRFYVEKIKYDFSKMVEFDTEIIRGEQLESRNDFDEPISQQISLSYTTSESIHWEKNFKNTFSIEFKMGYNSATTEGGPTWALTLADKIETGWSQGTTHTESSTSTITTNIPIPPKKAVNAFVQQSKSHMRVPYTMEGYYLMTDGTKKYDVIHDTCVLSNYSKTQVFTKNADETEPVLLMSL